MQLIRNVSQPQHAINILLHYRQMLTAELNFLPVQQKLEVDVKIVQTIVMANQQNYNVFGIKLKNSHAFGIQLQALVLIEHALMRQQHILPMINVRDIWIPAQLNKVEVVLPEPHVQQH